MPEPLCATKCRAHHERRPQFSEASGWGLDRHRVGREDGSWASPSSVKEGREDESGEDWGNPGEGLQCAKHTGHPEVA